MKVVRTVNAVRLAEFSALGNFTAVTYEGPGAHKACHENLVIMEC